MTPMTTNLVLQRSWRALVLARPTEQGLSSFRDAVFKALAGYRMADSSEFYDALTSLARLTGVATLTPKTSAALETRWTYYRQRLAGLMIRPIAVATQLRSSFQALGNELISSPMPYPHRDSRFSGWSQVRASRLNLTEGSNPSVRDYPGWRRGS